METKKRPLILISNDDGVHAKGLNILIEIMRPYGNLLVVAPDKGNSGKGHAVSLDKPIFVNKVSENQGLTVYSCSGTPTDCVKIALHELLTVKPDLIVSGINHGSNTSVSVIYSGTMAVAIEGTLNGIPSVGFSLATYDSDADFTVVEENIHPIIKEVLSNGLPEGVCLNVNYPDISPQKAKGIKVCRQTRGSWVEKFQKNQTPHGKDYYWLTGKFINFEPQATDTDEWALQNLYVAVVPIKIDLTSHETLNKLNFS